MSEQVKSDDIFGYLQKFKEQKIIFWGASLFLKEFLKNNDFSKFDIVGIVDKNPNLQGTEFCGYKVFSPKDLKNLPDAMIILTVVNNSTAVYVDVRDYLIHNKLNEKFDFCSITSEELFKTNYCPCCDNESLFWDYGEELRRNALCRHCLSLERHRFIYFVYKMFITPQYGQKLKILHMAPEKAIRAFFVNNESFDYASIDINPSLYSHAPECQKMNFLNLDFADNTFDFIINNHVIEHIDDEQRFFNESLRVLKQDGKMILSAPIYDMEETLELPFVKTDEDRLKYYGQKDHVRKYGKDIYKRFEKYGKISKIGLECFPKTLRNYMVMDADYNDGAIIVEKRG